MPNLDPTPDERIAWLDDLTDKSHTLRTIAAAVLSVTAATLILMFAFGVI